MKHGESFPMVSRLTLFALVTFLCVPTPVQSHPSSDDPLIFIIIDFRDFMCPACLDSLIRLCDVIPTPLIEESVRGIVVFSKEDAGSQDDAVKIMRKKIRGFQKANQIRFPLILDRDGIFAAAAHKGSCVIVFDPAGSSLTRFFLPLSQQKINQLLQQVFEGAESTRGKSRIAQPLF